MHHLKITIASKSSGISTSEPKCSTEVPSTDKEVSCRRQARPTQIRPIVKTPFSDREKDKRWNLGLLGIVMIRRRSKHAIQKSTDPTVYGRRKVVECQTISIYSPLLRRWFDMRMMRQGGQILTALSFHPVMMETAPVFQLCKTGNMQGLQAAFSSGTVTPFVLDEWGQTLLHVSSHKSLWD